VLLAGTPLLRRTPSGFAPRAPDEVRALIGAAYGKALETTDLSSGLKVAADALNAGDVGRAMIAGLHLRLPPLSADGAARLARAEMLLKKYDPNEPRDWRGRWTTEGASSGGPAARPLRGRRGVGGTGRRQVRTGDLSPPRVPATYRSPQNDSGGGSSWGGPTHLFGGRLIYAADEEPGIGDNGPPPDPVEVPGAEPRLDPEELPPGWETPGQTRGGLYYPPTRTPRFRDGTLWPVATPDVIRRILAPDGKTTPKMIIYVPADGIGPILVGSDTKGEMEEPPPIYSMVRLWGTPQVTNTREGPTQHAHESVVEALGLAASNRFSDIYFNRSFSTITGRNVLSLSRSDVVAVYRSESDSPYHLLPREILSPGQTTEDRESQMPKDAPWIAPVRGRGYNKFMRLRFEPSQQKLGQSCL
jgi:hypothetical protein